MSNQTEHAARANARMSVGRRPSADAALVALSEELLQRATALHRNDRGGGGMDDDDYDYEHDAVHESGRALLRMQAATMGGLIAKARLVRVQFERAVACDAGATVEDAGEQHEVMAWSVLNDLLELTGSLADLPTFPGGSKA